MNQKMRQSLRSGESTSSSLTIALLCRQLRSVLAQRAIYYIHVWEGTNTGPPVVFTPVYNWLSMTKHTQLPREVTLLSIL